MPKRAAPNPSVGPAVKPCLSIHLVNFAPTQSEPGRWQRLFDLAVAADRSGIGKVVVSDHVAFGERLDHYADPARGGIAGGRQPTGPDGAWLEPLTVLAMVGALTQRVRLGTAVLLAALRRPVVLAKTAATLDVLTGGRFEMGVGIGWQQAEYEAAGLDFGARGRLLDHALEVCTALWSQQRVSYASGELGFDGIHQMPKPANGRVPVWVSGTVNPRAMTRLARFGRGWIPWGPDAADVVSGIAAMRDAVAAAGRDPYGIEVAAMLPVVRNSDGEPQIAPTMAAVEDLVAAGVTDFRISLRPPAGVPAAQEYLMPWAEAFTTVAAAAAA